MSDIYIYLTPRVQKNAHHTKYIDISTCEYSSKTGMKFRQFILGKGNCLSSDKESEFLDMMQQHPYIHIEKEIYEKFADDISEYFPELHWSYSYDTIEADGAAKAFSHLSVPGVWHPERTDTGMGRLETFHGILSDICFTCFCCMEAACYVMRWGYF